MAPLSLADDTFMPVFTRFCVVSSALLVAFKVCSATSAPRLVLIELAILASHFTFISRRF